MPFADPKDPPRCRVPTVAGPAAAWPVRRHLLAFGLLAVLAGPASASHQVMTLHYQERPPYSSTGADGQPRGLLVAPLLRALARSGIVARWSSTPGQRQLALIQRGNGLDCGIGWFRTPERESLGRFSRPIYRDRPLQALVRDDSPIADGTAVADLLTNSTLSMLAKEGYSYGPAIDQQLERQHATVIYTHAESASMARMLAAGRASWMLVSAEEMEVLLGASGPDKLPLRLVAVRGVDAGLSRHLYCNREVSPTLIERIDRALAEP